jgi:hypothetical protein
MRSVHPDKRLSMLLHSVFGEDTWRFAAMFGTFVSTYKFILNALPILLPFIDFRPRAARLLSQSKNTDTFTESDAEDDEADSNELEKDDLEKSGGITFKTRRPSRLQQQQQQGGRKPRVDAMTSLTMPSTPGPSTASGLSKDKRTARLSLSAQTQLILIRKRTRRWHALLAGFLSGFVSILLEARSRRNTISQQMFVRGLQGWWNEFAYKKGVKIPNGDVLVFGLACGQIMWAFLMREETLPRSYNVWIANASKVPYSGIKMNKTLVREGIARVEDIDGVLAWKVFI